MVIQLKPQWRIFCSSANLNPAECDGMLEVFIATRIKTHLYEVSLGRMRLIPPLKLEVERVRKTNLENVSLCLTPANCICTAQLVSFQIGVKDFNKFCVLSLFRNPLK